MLPLSMQKRNEEIDFMRGVSIVAMILIHTTAFSKADKVAFFLWDMSQFAVPVFVFCSGYLFFIKESHENLFHSVSYVAKRASRLLVPYYLFLFAYIPLVLLANPREVTIGYILQNIFLIGGVNLNWMVLMFLYLSLLSFPLLFLYNKQRLIFYLYCATSVGFSIFFLFSRPSHYRPVMWLTWSSVTLVSWYFAEKIKKEKDVLLVVFSSFVLFLTLRGSLLNTHRSIIQFDNKYPPNVYHLLYGMLGISLLYLAGLYLKGKTNGFTKIIYYFSANSYQLFFIHFWLLYLLRDVFSLNPHWLILFVVLMGGSIIIQQSIARMRLSVFLR